MLHRTQPKDLILPGSSRKVKRVAYKYLNDQEAVLSSIL